VSVVGEMDALALTVLAVKLFVDRAPKEVVAELTLENRLLKKSVTADGEDVA